MISINTHWYSIFRQILPDIASSFKIKRTFIFKRTFIPDDGVGVMLYDY